MWYFAWILGVLLACAFGIINVMTQGGPGGATNILVYKVYQDGFVGLDLSGSSAQSVIHTSWFSTMRATVPRSSVA